jgi:hypothetical protein
MDLQTRKLNAIGYLINLQDEKKLNKIEATIFELKTAASKKLKPFTKKQLVDRARKANQDYSEGKIKTQEQIETDSINW